MQSIFQKSENIFRLTLHCLSCALSGCTSAVPQLSAIEIAYLALGIDVSEIPVQRFFNFAG